MAIYHCQKNVSNLSDYDVEQSALTLTFDPVQWLIRHFCISVSIVRITAAIIRQLTHHEVATIEQNVREALQ